MSKLRLSMAGAALTALVLALLNLVSYRLYLRADLSSGRIYSLSAGSKRILRGLSDPVEVRAYFSKELPPQFAASLSYVRDMLAEYRNASRGKLRYRFIDLDRGESGKREALKEGVAPIQFNVVSREKFEVREGFMGLVLQYADKKEALPVVSKPESLEFDLTSTILRLTRPKRKMVAVLSSHGALGPERLSQPVKDALSRNYELRPLDLRSLKPGAAIPAEVEALLVLGPQERLAEGDLFALDQFLLSGRPLAMGVDARRADFRSFMASPNDTGLSGWLKAQGISLRQNLVLDLQCQRVQVTQSRGWLMFANIIEYPLFAVSSELDKEHPLTRGLNAVTFPLASPLTVERASGTVRTLARSSKRSWLRSAWARGAVFNISPLQELAPTEGDPKGPFTLAVAIEDEFTSAFPNPPKGADPKAFLPKSVRPGRLLVIGTSRFAAPDMPSGETGPAFLMNVVDWLALESDLLSIRSKGAVYRPLLEVHPALKTAVRWSNILGPSLLVAAFGLYRLRKRRSSRAFRRAFYASTNP
ncbi:MAG: GldG family protein [Elusimicrobia bacterium]|nr:GldG family protein [Elusimicrobiota bacterium]